MRKNKKKSIVVIMFLMILGISLLGGCKKEEADSLDSQESVPVSENNQPSSEAVTDTTDGTISEEEPTKNLPIYCLQEESLEREPVIAIIPEDTAIDAEFVVKTVVDAFEERSILIGIDSVISKEDTVIVNFKKDEIPITNVGTSAESGILDSISMSLLDNVKSCQKVIFRIEGEAYETGHMLFGIDEPYKTLNK